MTQAAQTSTGDRSVNHGSFTLERVYPVSPARVFQAYADAALKRRWFAEGEGFEVLEYRLDFQVGGREFARFRFGGGADMTFDSLYMDIIPEQRIVAAYSMTNAGEPFSASLGTTEFQAAAGGTRMVYTEQCAFFDGKDELEQRRQGTLELLEALAKALEE